MQRRPSSAALKIGNGRRLSAFQASRQARRRPTRPGVQQLHIDLSGGASLQRQPRLKQECYASSDRHSRDASRPDALWGHQVTCVRHACGKDFVCGAGLQSPMDDRRKVPCVFPHGVPSGERQDDLMLDVDKPTIASIKALDANQWTHLNALEHDTFINPMPTTKNQERSEDGLLWVLRPAPFRSRPPKLSDHWPFKNHNVEMGFNCRCRFRRSRFFWLFWRIGHDGRNCEAPLWLRDRCIPDVRCIGHICWRRAFLKRWGSHSQRRRFVRLDS